MQIIHKYRFFIIFSLIGGLCVLIDYGFYFLFINLVGVIFLSKIMSSIISVSVNYLLNSRFNFNNQRKVKIKHYLAYIVMYAILILLNAAINMVLIKLTANLRLSFWIAAVIAAFTNYFSVRFFFKKINQ